MYLEAYSHYRPTTYELLVDTIYNELGIEHPNDIDIEHIAYELSITLFSSSYDSMSGEKNGKKMIVLQQDLSEQERKEVFFHELTHLLRHSGDQLVVSADLHDIQERDANTMPYYWLMPTRMIMKSYIPENLDQAVRYLAEYFDVTSHFAHKRIHMLISRLELIMAENQLATALNAGPRFGRDYDDVVIIGRNELYYKNGRVVGHLMHMEA